MFIICYICMHTTAAPRPPCLFVIVDMWCCKGVFMTIEKIGLRTKTTRSSRWQTILKRHVCL